MTATRRVTLHVRLVAATQGRTCDREALHTGFYASPRASRASCLQQTEALRGTRRDVEMGDRLQGHLAASQLSQWETPKYPCPRIHCPPRKGALSLTSGRRKERQLGPPGPVRRHSFPPPSQSRPSFTRHVPGVRQAGALRVRAPQRTARELQRSPAEGGSCLARRDGEGPTGITFHHPLCPSPHRPGSHRAGSLPGAPRGSRHAAATSAPPMKNVFQTHVKLSLHESFKMADSASRRACVPKRTSPAARLRSLRHSIKFCYRSVPIPLRVQFMVLGSSH